MAENKMNHELSERELSNVVGGINKQHPGASLGDQVTALRKRSMAAAQGNQGNAPQKRRIGGLDDVLP